MGLAAAILALWPAAVRAVTDHPAALSVWLLVLAVALAANARLSLRRARGSDE